MKKSILSDVTYSSKSNKGIVGEVVTEYIRPRLENCVKIFSSKDCFNFIGLDWDGIDHFESFKAIFLNRSNHIIAGPVTISIGGVSGCVADPKIIFQKALACNASGIIVAHNHPSGNLVPSTQDETLTQKLKQGGIILDIKLLDHLIVISGQKYYSFADEGKI